MTGHATAPEPEDSEAAQSDLTSPRPTLKLPDDLSEYTNQELFDAYNTARQLVDLIAIETEKRFH